MASIWLTQEFWELKPTSQKRAVVPHPCLRRNEKTAVGSQLREQEVGSRLCPSAASNICFISHSDGVGLVQAALFCSISSMFMRQLCSHKNLFFRKCVKYELRHMFLVI